MRLRYVFCVTFYEFASARQAVYNLPKATSGEETMADYNDREAFIPYRRADLIDMCVEDGQLSEADQPQFRQFCEILSAYYHFELHRSLEMLKENFAPFNPDSDTKRRFEPTPDEQKAMEHKLVETLTIVLERANYQLLGEQDLKTAFEESSLVPLKTQVDFDDFEQMVFYYRGDIFKTTTFKKFYFWTEEREIDILERVTLLLKFKPAAHFEAKGQKTDDLEFEPGKMYLYFYKNIPRHDLELLFPNVKVSMTLKDQLLFGIPAIGAGIAALFRTLPNLLLIVGALLFLMFGPNAIRQIGVSEGQVQNIMPVLTAALALLVALGGVAVKQWTSYKTKQIKFQKSLTDTLFFRMLDVNAGVFHALIDSAEEEETKEIILVYYHLLTSDSPLTQAALDDRIEHWLEEKFNAKIDFDINGPLRNLEKLRGQVADDGPLRPLLRRDEQGRLHLLSLAESKQVIDYVWDNIFRYNNSLEPETVKAINNVPT